MLKACSMNILKDDRKWIDEDWEGLMTVIGGAWWWVSALKIYLWWIMNVGTGSWSHAQVPHYMAIFFLEFD